MEGKTNSTQMSQKTETEWVNQIHKLQKKMHSVCEKIDTDSCTIQSILTSKKCNKKVIKFAWKALCKHIKKYHNLSRIAFYMSVGERNWQDERKQYLLKDKYIFKCDYQKSNLVDVLHIRDSYSTVVQKCLQSYSTRANVSILEKFNEFDWHDLSDEFMKFKYLHHSL